jgi:hypothetical protein
MWAGADWTWHLPVRRNDAITARAWLKELVEHQTAFAGRAIQQIYHVDFSNQRGELVAAADSWCFRTDRDLAREHGTKYTEVKAKPPSATRTRSWPRCTGSTRARKCAAPVPRYWGDVREGDRLPAMAKGPMTVTGFIAYAQGWGGLYIRANKLAWKQIHRHSGLGIKNRFGIPDCPERVHWEHEFATMVGAPGAYDYGPERCSWLTHHLTNWMGDDGILRRAHCKIRRHNPRATRCASRAPWWASASRAGVTSSRSSRKRAIRTASCRWWEAAWSSCRWRDDGARRSSHRGRARRRDLRRRPLPGPRRGDGRGRSAAPGSSTSSSSSATSACRPPSSSPSAGASASPSNTPS